MIRHGLKSGAAALALAGALASAAPAEARGLRGGFGAGLLFGALAAGALAAAAEHAEASQAYAGLPDRGLRSERPPLPETRVLSEEHVLEEAPRAAGWERARRLARPRAADAPARAAPSAGTAGARAVETCGRSLVEASRPYGGLSVSAAPTGPAIRAEDGSVTVPLDARVAYAGSPARRARVACRLDAGGRVVALR